MVLLTYILYYITDKYICIIVNHKLMQSEPVRINSDTMNKLRQHLAKTTNGRMYGKISSTIDDAIKEYLERNS